MSLSLADTIQRVLARAPAWIRSELATNDVAGRQRAEEALAAMIAAAITDGKDQPSPASRRRD